MIQFKTNRVSLVGLIVIVLSTILFIVPDIFHQEGNKDFFSGTILIHFSVAIIFTIYCKIENLKAKFKFFEHNRQTGTLTGVLFWISCFALNRDLPIFHQSINWLSAIIVICTITLLIEVFITFTNKNLQIAYAALSGLTSVVLLYYTIYLMPFWGIGLIGMILIGLGGHVFVPFLMLLNQIKVIKKVYTSTHTAIAYSTGVGLPIIAILILSSIVSTANRNLQKTVTQAQLQTDIPAWVYISQHTPKSMANSLVLRKALVYPYFFWGFKDDIPNGKSNREKRHNPALVIADMLNPSNKSDNKLSYDDRLNILLSDFEEHNEKEERLWRGDMLSTSKIKTEIELFPAHRIAYTEKSFWIKNGANPKYTWNNQQEAIYTFHMPEGTVVTSLSLWVNGKEEKGILTSKKKAEKAYNTIVGKEKRDPSLVTWKEGNMITVRVFPCTPSDERQVKIGFTSPMPIRNKNLFYQALQFEGPALAKAQEEIIIHNGETFDAIQINLNEKDNTLYYNGDYQKHWNLVCPAPALSSTSFCFHDDCYETKPLATHQEQIQHVYLDITNDWTEEEINQLLDASAKKSLYYYNNETLQTIKNDDDIDEAIAYGSSLRFSLFPFHKLTTQQNVVITKGGVYSAKWSQLGKLQFEKSIRNWVKEGNTTNVVLIGSVLTPYQKGLLEFKALNLTQHSFEEACTIVSNEKLQTPYKSKNAVNIYQSELSIHKTTKTNTTKNKAPDHLMRLYAYNYVMANAIKLNEEDSNQLEHLVDVAQTAYVVSPVSSLIVLETQQDYKDHNITDKKDSLHNATISSSGSAPEPHKWMMIIMTLAVVLYYLHKKWGVGSLLRFRAI